MMPGCIFQDALENCVPTYKPKEKKSLYIYKKGKESSLEEVPLDLNLPSDHVNFKSINNQLRSLIRNLRKVYKKNWFKMSDLDHKFNHLSSPITLALYQEDCVPLSYFKC